MPTAVTAPPRSSLETAAGMQGDVAIEIDAYELLWRSRVRVHLPETIVFKFGRLDAWFFASFDRKGQPPRIKRKRDYTVRRGDVVDKIIDSFCAHATSEQDLVATWVSGPPGENCRVLHLTKKTLAQFLAFIKHTQKGHGVLQRWCAPFGGHSTMLRTEWSPHYFGLDQCTNWHPVSDQRQPLGERLATFEGECRHVTRTSVVNENLHRKVEQLNAEIARRIDEQQQSAKVWQLQCNWKPCADGAVRLIWCSRLVLEPTAHDGFAIDREEIEGVSASLTSSAFTAEPAERFVAPVAAKWDGGSTPCDGSIFHIPLPGMTSFREPTWWRAERLVGITNLLPSATAPGAKPSLPRDRKSVV